MKVSLKSVLAVLALGLAVIPSLSMAADAAPAGGQGQGGGGGRGRQTPEQQLAGIDTAVTLTADQKTKVTAILAKSSAAMQAIPQDDADRRTKSTEIRAAANKEIRALLTAEQQVKFDAMPQGGRGQGGQGGGNRGSAAPAPAAKP